MPDKKDNTAIPETKVPESVREMKERKTKADVAETGTREPEKVSAGTIDRVVDYAFNPTREKIREMTSVNRMQAMLLPQLDLVGQQWNELIEIAAYRQDSTVYARLFKQAVPDIVDPIELYIYRFAQWSKSRDGMNLKSAVDLALAEQENRAGEEGEGYGGTDAWGKE